MKQKKEVILVVLPGLPLQLLALVVLPRLPLQLLVC